MDARPDPVTRRGTAWLLLPGGLALLGGLYAGLLRIGWTLPAPPLPLAAVHGPLMVGGFLGTLIALERAVALGSRAGFAVPALCGAGALALLGGVAGPWAPLLATAGSGGLVAMSAGILRRQPALHHAALTLGAFAWLVANILWLAGWPVYRLVAWWIAFLVLTIAGERLELSRVLRPSSASRAAFALAAGLLLAAVTIGTFAPLAGGRVAGLALLAIAGWLARYDVARRTVRQAGLTRFIAAAMLSGYLWLAVAGALFLAEAGRLVAGPAYDAALHTVFVGFVFSMIFGHAPVIVPAVLKVPVPYRPAFYAHLALLHVAVALRVTGDLADWWSVRRWGGLLSAAAIAVFLAVTARSVRLGARAERPPELRPDSGGGAAPGAGGAGAMAAGFERGRAP